MRLSIRWVPSDGHRTGIRPYHVRHRQRDRWLGTAMLCYVTPKEHLALPDKEDV